MYDDDKTEKNSWGRLKFFYEIYKALDWNDNMKEYKLEKTKKRLQ